MNDVKGCNWDGGIWTDHGQVCNQRHCGTCSEQSAHHVAWDEQVCPQCVGKARAHLRAIEDMATALPEEAQERGVRSEAAYLAGPVANAEAFRNRRVSIMAGRLALPLPEEDAHHPLAVLGRWVLFVGEDYNDLWPDDKAMTVSALKAWLEVRLPRIAHDVGANGQAAHDFDGFLAELRDCRRHLEDVLRDGEQIERGAPCPACPVGNKPALRLKRVDVDTTGKSDRWQCPRDKAHHWDDEEYRLKIGAAYLTEADRLTAADMLRAYRVPEGSLRAWATLGKVRKRGRDGSGRVLYDVSDTKAMRDNGTTKTG